MSKIVLSWIATTHDFEGGAVRDEGPTANLHRYLWDFDKHLILTSSGHDDEHPRVGLLRTYLNKAFPDHPVEIVHMDLEDVISVNEIRGKVERLLEEHREDEMHIFASPGTSSMMTAWYFAHIGLGLDTHIFQVRPPTKTASGLPEAVYEEIVRSSEPSTLTIREVGSSSAVVEADYIITPSIEPVYRRAQQAADTDNVTCLILGESGTGKEHLARYIHEQSSRKNGPFVPVNCSALGESILESRLFGYVKGAFTGADKEMKGIFEAAAGGTVFLDEIGDASPYLQQALLRVLQEHKIQRVGGAGDIPVDIRVICATHQDLVELCKEGKFRWDLYYRITVAELILPPLRDRGVSEIRQLIDHFLESKKTHLRKAKRLKLDREAKRALEAYPYPGNIRELENLIERLYVFRESESGESRGSATASPNSFGRCILPS